MQPPTARAGCPALGFHRLDLAGTASSISCNLPKDDHPALFSSIFCLGGGCGGDNWAAREGGVLGASCTWHLSVVLLAPCASLVVLLQVVQVVVCRLTPLQRQLYEHFLLSNATRRLLAGSKATGVLSAITCLKK
jgi:hypothetical protein